MKGGRNQPPPTSELSCILLGTSNIQVTLTALCTFFQAFIFSHFPFQILFHCVQVGTRCCVQFPVLYSTSLLIIVVSHPVMSDSLVSHGLQPARLLHPWNSPNKRTDVGSHSLLPGIFPTQGLNSGLLYCGRFFTI